MVFSGNKLRGEREREELMERSKPLHNFRLPCLKWGNQRLLRCMKVNSNGEISAVDRKSALDSTRFIGRRGSSDRRRENMKSLSLPWPAPAKEVGISVVGDGYEIEATREKLMFDFQKEVGKMKDAILREGLEEEEEEEQPPPVPDEIEAARPWNLRTRRAACKAPSPPVREREKPTSSLSPLRNECKSSGEKRERAKFSVSLSRRELEEDFMTMAGRRLPRKPKKRPKIVQKQLDTLFPGLWLTEINADLYRVPDDPEAGKR